MGHETVTGPETIGVVIPTFGDKLKWGPLVKRAFWSAVNSGATEVHHEHGETLAAARNRGAEFVDTHWLVFLDADDELDEGYCAGMRAGAGDLRQPATLGVYPDGTTDDGPVLIEPRPLLSGNFLVIGTMVERERFMRVGGFRELPAWEDWDLWIRCWLDGARIGRAPEAIYRVHVNPLGRNSVSQAVAGRLYKQIRDTYRLAARERLGLSVS